MDDYRLYIALTIVVILLAFIIRGLIKNPFKLPKISNKIDISGRRTPDYDECIEEWIVDQYKQNRLIMSMLSTALDKWDEECKKKIKRSFLFYGYRKHQYNKMKLKVSNMNYEMFEFTFYRIHHSNNQSTETVEKVVLKTNSDILTIDTKLQDINYVSSLSKYNESNQRKLMTNQLRQKIKIRDNYTCRICGISKQFLDNLCPGLGDYLLFEIDHIKPVCQGGVTVDEDNLQCLCWRCNRAKGGDKTNEEIASSIDYGIDKLLRQ